MSIRARQDRADIYLCDREGCTARRASNCGVPRGWVEGHFGSFHLCTADRDLLNRYNQIAATHGVRALYGRKGCG